MLDVFRFDPNFEENELLWEQIKKEILGDDDDIRRCVCLTQGVVAMILKQEGQSTAVTLAK